MYVFDRNHGLSSQQEGEKMRLKLRIQLADDHTLENFKTPE